MITYMDNRETFARVLMCMATASAFPSSGPLGQIHEGYNLVLRRALVKR